MVLVGDPPGGDMPYPQRSFMAATTLKQATGIAQGRGSWMPVFPNPEAAMSHAASKKRLAVRKGGCSPAGVQFQGPSAGPSAQQAPPPLGASPSAGLYDEYNTFYVFQISHSMASTLLTDIARSVNWRKHSSEYFEIDVQYFADAFRVGCGRNMVHVIMHMGHITMTTVEETMPPPGHLCLTTHEKNKAEFIGLHNKLFPNEMQCQPGLPYEVPRYHLPEHCTLWWALPHGEVPCDLPPILFLHALGALTAEESAGTRSTGSRLQRRLSQPEDTILKVKKPKLHHGTQQSEEEDVCQKQVEPEMDIVQITIKLDMFHYLVNNDLLVKWPHSMFQCYEVRGKWPENAGQLGVSHMRRTFVLGSECKLGGAQLSSMGTGPDHDRYKVLATSLQDTTAVLGENATRVGYWMAETLARPSMPGSQMGDGRRVV